MAAPPRTRKPVSPKNTKHSRSENSAMRCRSQHSHRRISFVTRHCRFFWRAGCRRPYGGMLCGVDHVKAPFIFDPSTRGEPSVGSPAGRTRIECRGDARKPGSPLLFCFYSGRHGLVRDRTRNHQPHRAYLLAYATLIRNVKRGWRRPYCRKRPSRRFELGGFKPGFPVRR
jgi:hypothetical protein